MSFYVYLYLDPSVKSSFIYGSFRFNHEPYYVGKGKGKRFKSLKRNKHCNERTKSILQAGLKPIIKRFNCSSENSAYEIEECLIAVIGRASLNQGPLTNLTAGGEGLNGVRESWSKERWDQFYNTCSASKKGMWDSFTVEQREQRRQSIIKGRQNMSDEDKALMIERAAKARMQVMPELQKKRKQTLSKRSRVQKIAQVVRWRRSIANRSEEKQLQVKKNRIKGRAKQDEETRIRNFKESWFKNHGAKFFILVSPLGETVVVSSLNMEPLKQFENAPAISTIFQTETYKIITQYKAKGWLIMNNGKSHLLDKELAIEASAAHKSFNDGAV